MAGLRADWLRIDQARISAFAVCVADTLSRCQVY
jgi:hypothetical protein